MSVNYCNQSCEFAFRGKRNESAYVRYVCAKVAELCGTDERRVEEATERNVRAMFGDSIFC